MFTAWGDTSSGDMTASNVQYEKDSNNKNTKINSFTLNGKFNYENVGTDNGKTTLTPTKSALQKVVKEKLLPQWSGIASAVFRDQASQLVDLYGYKNNGGSMTQAGFNAYFDRDHSGDNEYADETWSCGNLRDMLKQTNASHKGDKG